VLNKYTCTTHVRNPEAKALFQMQVVQQLLLLLLPLLLLSWSPEMPSARSTFCSNAFKPSNKQCFACDSMM
jgi:hypothetical protein